MIRRLFRLAILAGIAAGVAAAVRALRSDEDPLPAPATPSEPWPPLPPEPAAAPSPPPRAAPTAPVAPTPTTQPTTMPEPDGMPIGGASYVEPTADGECPDGYPIKAKLSSKIFHSPGQLNYDRTTPDRCYVDAATAEADGMRAAKR